MTRSHAASVILLAGVVAISAAAPGRARALTPAATPSLTASPTAVAPSVPPVYYQDGFQGGRAIYAVYPDGTGPTLIAAIPRGNPLQPVLFPDGRLAYPAGNGFAVFDRYGHRYGLGTPTLNAGEAVWSIAPSPDGRTLAWQLFAPLQFSTYTTEEGVARIVLTGRFGGAGTTIFTAQAESQYGQVPVLVGWRQFSPYSAGGPTLLLQDLYSGSNPSLGLLPNVRRGLLEYDPQVDDLVNDYSPPGNSDIPPQRALTVSGDGVWAVFGDGNSFTPSGEGSLAQVVDALNLDTNAAVQLDSARNYPTSTTVVTTRKRKVKKRTVTTRVTTQLRLYQYFSSRAYVAPGDGRVLYTLLTVSYPPGSLQPRVASSTLVATMDGRTRVVAAADAEAQGWLNGHMAVIKRADGLYTLDVVSGGMSRLAIGAGARYIGARS